MEYELAWFNSIFELMAVYNFAFVGLDQVSRHTLRLGRGLKEKIFSDQRRGAIEALVAGLDTKSAGELAKGDFYALGLGKFVLAEIKYVSTTLQTYRRKVNDRRFVSLYSFFGLYCFVTLIIGAIMQYDKQVSHRLFYFLDVYNLSLIVPLSIFFFRQHKPTSPLTFFAVVILHFMLAIVFINEENSPERLFKTFSNFSITQIDNLSDASKVISFIVLLLVFDKIRQYIKLNYASITSKTSSSSLFSLLTPLCFILGYLAVLILYAIWTSNFVGILKINTMRTTLTCVALPLLPLTIVIFQYTIWMTILNLRVSVPLSLYSKFFTDKTEDLVP